MKKENKNITPELFLSMLREMGYDVIRIKEVLDIYKKKMNKV